MNWPNQVTYNCMTCQAGILRVVEESKTVGTLHWFYFPLDAEL